MNLALDLVKLSMKWQHLINLGAICFFPRVKISTSGTVDVTLSGINFGITINIGTLSSMSSVRVCFGSSHETKYHHQRLCSRRTDVSCLMLVGSVGCHYWRWYNVWVLIIDDIIVTISSMLVYVFRNYSCDKLFYTRA